ncbi:unnamed protein product, partial [Dracunculus medinensis]|uniref:Ovule protein n=1 Tax=Dracunculus medinensis TaxID=318479 RepID=A0A0N4UR16_DRAME
ESFRDSANDCRREEKVIVWHVLNVYASTFVRSEWPSFRFSPSDRSKNVTLHPVASLQRTQSLFSSLGNMTSFLLAI